MHGRALVFWERLGAGCVVQVLTAKEAVQHSPVQTIYFCRLLSGTYRPAQAVAIDVNGGEKGFCAQHVIQHWVNRTSIGWTHKDGSLLPLMLLLSSVFCLGRLFFALSLDLCS